MYPYYFFENNNFSLSFLQGFSDFLFKWYMDKGTVAVKKMLLTLTFLLFQVPLDANKFSNTCFHETVNYLDSR